jgi:hypothetical protein
MLAQPRSRWCKDPQLRHQDRIKSGPSSGPAGSSSGPWQGNLVQLANESYDLVITDLGREHSSDRSATAGAAFLDQPIVRSGGPPVIVYAGSWALAQRDALIARGALDVMAHRQHLFDTVLGVLGRSPQTGDELER